MNVKQTSRKITQKMGELERTLLPKLKQFYNQKIKNSQKSLSQIRQESGQSLENLVRKVVEDSWLFSNQILQDSTNKQINLSVNDIQGIETITNRMVNQFWTTAQKLHTRETEFKITPENQIEQLPEFDMAAAMIGLASLFAFYSFNQAMASKSDEIGGIKLRFTVRSDCIDSVICLPLNGKIWEVNDPNRVIPPFETHRHCHCHLIPIVT
jgi:hypothetical protein